MRHRKLWCALIGALLAVTGPAAANAAPAAYGAGPAGPAKPGGPAATVTLVTGDTVRLSTAGGRIRVTVEPAPGAGVSGFQQFQVDGDRYVLPARAAGLVQEGVLDRQLFNVTGLVRQGYDDAHVAGVPLLVRYADATAGAGLVTAVPATGGTVRRRLPGLNMVALDERKASAATFWSRTLTAPVDAGTRSGAAGPRPGAGGPRVGGPAAPKAGPLRLAPGLTRIWLNGKVRASLAESVPQIGAPTAWANGYTGTGVTVAVLDSGIDAGHPDFAGRIAATKDFSGEGSVADGRGHGTHVASIVAGSGAASGGRYKGVAPDTRLAIGKVLDSTGSGTFDGVLAGMQWAAAESGARVVNMSLGAGPTDGTDPVSVTLNNLTARYGTLFVVSAGNAGADGSVSTPAAADDALAVGSVSKSDVLSSFSSRGPRAGDGALKPDLAAPGEGIVAAKASGIDPLGEPVDEAYQRLDGTSMAAPHVTGAAALLAQQHPDWTAARLKMALTSTAAPLDANPYAVGTGRVDVARASTQAVTATGSASVSLPWPNSGTTRTTLVTWQNGGSTAVTLSVSASVARRDGAPAPAGLLSLSASTVTVPAGGNATVRVTVTAQDGAPGSYAGILSATSADGAVRTRTALSVYQEEERFDLTVNVLDRGGDPLPADYPYPLALYDLDTASNWRELAPGETVRLPRGRYALHATIMTARDGKEPSLSLISHAELTLDHDTVSTLDARVGQPASISVDDPAARGGSHHVGVYSRIADCGCDFLYGNNVDPRFTDVYVGTVPGPASQSYAFVQGRTAIQPEVELFGQDGAAAPYEIPAYWLSRSPAAERGSMTAVYAGAATPEDLAKVDVTGRLVIAGIPVTTSRDEILARLAAIAGAGGRWAMLIPTEGSSTAVAMGGGGGTTDPALPTLYTRGDSPAVRRLVESARTGPASVSYTVTPFPAQRYELGYGGPEGRLTGPQVHHAHTADLVAVRTRYHDNAPGAVHTVQAYAEYRGRDFGAGHPQLVLGAQQRTEYFTPGTWFLIESAPSNEPVEQAVTFGASGNPRITWDKAVSGPSWQVAGFDPTNAGVWRVDGALVVHPPMFSDSAGRPRVPQPHLGASGSISLYRDGEPAGAEPAPDFAYLPVPDAPAGYRLVAHAEAAPGSVTLSTKVDASWTFRSSAADQGSAVPLVTVRFDPEVDLLNRAPGDQRFSFPAYVSRQGATAVAVASLTVDVSYDDGRTWEPATVKVDGDQFQITVRHPATGFASLRARASDMDGNTVEQTIIRAYSIGG